MVGVMGSGNRNFGRHYQMAARQIAAQSHRPVLFEFEIAGTPWDVEECRGILADLDAALATEHAGHDGAHDAGHDEQAGSTVGR
jgi:protein involved in ribonucleotide reduction